MEGVCAIQMGENPRIIELKLCSVLGERFTAIIREAVHDREEKRSVARNRFLEATASKEAWAESRAF